VLRRLCGPTKEVPGNWTKMHNEEFHNLYYSPTIITMIKSRKTRMAGMKHMWGR
jgi:hypothetical protein